MAQNKWHKEIKAWADGIEIEQRCKAESDAGWEEYKGKWEEWEEFDGEWTEDSYYEYRIKPQPKEPQYLYAYYLRGISEIHWSDSEQKQDPSLQYIGKIKLEVEDE
jgi:hypothetical protein